LRPWQLGYQLSARQSAAFPIFLIEGETGFLCQPNDPQSIADTINRILNLDKNKLNQIKDNALRLVSARFNWDVVGDSMRQIFLAITK
jgi:glycosyltransferase involved in cell wall biosynthesis